MQPYLWWLLITVVAVIAYVWGRSDGYMQCCIDRVDDAIAADQPCDCAVPDPCYGSSRCVGKS